MSTMTTAPKRPPTHDDLPRIRRHSSEYGLRQLRSTGSDYPGDTEHLPRA